MNTNKMELSMKDLEMVNGSSFLPDQFTELEYGCCGIKVVNHFLKPNEYWWQGEDIGYFGAEKVMCFTTRKGRQPYSMEEAQEFINRLYDGGAQDFM